MAQVHSRAFVAEDVREEEALVDLEWTERQLELVPAGDRMALLLHARDGLSYEEIAEVKKLPLGTVKNKLFRARVVLKERLSGEVT